jgi:hypothetical protein
MRRFPIALVLASTSACSTNDGTLQIHSAISIDKTDCVLNPDSEAYLTTGMYDPRGVYGAPEAYSLNLIAKNTLSAPEEGAISGRESGNDVEIFAVDVCWFPAHPGSEGALEYSGYVDGVPEHLTCDKLPDAQKTTKVVSAPVSAEGRAAFSFLILETEALQLLYGTNFQPWAIPDQGEFTVTQGPTTTRYYSAAASDPTDLGGRHAAWGNFPAWWSARVIVQVRANAILLSGGTAQSNWFIFPVDICVGCAAAKCGTPEVEVCAPGEVFLVGHRPDPRDTCQPSQNHGPNCVEKACPEEEEDA